MKKKFVLSVLATAVFYVALTSYSSQPATGGVDGTGATGAGGCSCHGGMAAGITLAIELDSAGVPVTRYVGGHAYTIKITGTNTTTSNLPGFGFELTVVKNTGAGSASAINAGTLASTGLPASCVNDVLSGGSINMVEQLNTIAATTGTGTTGSTYSETIAWTAPAAGTGTVKIYGVINAVNGTGGTGGDKWNNGNVTITEEVAPTVSPITGTAIVCAGSTTTLADATPGGTWSSGSTGIATVSTSGVVTGVTAGTAVISYTVASAGTATITVTVNPLPVMPAAISGSSFTVCAGSAITLSDATTGGVWSSVSTTVATVSSTGIVTGVSGGTSIISYSNTNSCGTLAATAVVTVNPLPATPGAITGATTTVCVGSTVTYSETSTGGTWSSASPTVASVSSTGVITGLTAGVAVISYSETNACGTVAATKPVTVSAGPPSPGTISGTLGICLGATSTLTDATPGGVWSSSSSTVAPISATGVVSGLAIGTSVISYTLTNSCGSTAASAVVSVNTLPAVPAPIGGSGSLCVGFTTNLTESVPGGAWSSLTPGIAMVSASGIVTGISGGTDSIKYTIANGCGSNSVAMQVTVNPLPPAPAAITGTFVLCAGTTTTLADATPAGTWISANTSIATISATGVVNGISGGTDTIKYAISNICGSSFAVKVITVNTVPVAPPAMTGDSSICAGTSTTWTDATSGGVWASTNPGIASVASTGVISAGASGTTQISYTVANSCGTTTITRAITVNTIPVPPAAIAGTFVVCPGATTTLGDASAGGNWISASTAIATISASGVVTGVSAGTTLISYGVANICGSAFAYALVTVNPLPNAGTISGGTSSLCYLSSTTYTETVSGGTWSVSNPAVATISATGVLTGVAPGSEVVSYTYTNSCGTATATVLLSVINYPYAGTISGPSSICTGIPLTYNDPVTGGVWALSNSSATVSSGGVLVGSAAGTDTIIYTTSTPCGVASTTEVITINVSPDAGTITGTTEVCLGTTLTLYDPAPGGVWSDSGSTLAMLSGDVVTTLFSGTVNVYYTVTTSCGTDVAIFPLTIDPIPDGGVIFGSSEVCLGIPTTFVETATWGNWSSGSGVATVSASGVVTGVSLGTSTLTFTQSNTCGSATATYPITVMTTPAAPAAITGLDSVCVGSSINLNDATPGGTWTLSNATGSLWGPGIVYGNSTGTDTVYYAISNFCGSASAHHVVRIVSGPYCWPLGTLNQALQAGEMQLYPNPSNGDFSVVLPAGTSSASYVLVDAMGRVVASEYNQTVTNGSFTVQSGNVAPGTYVLKVNTADQVFRGKIQIEK